MADDEAGIWLRINAMLSKRFKRVCAFTDDAELNMSLLGSLIESAIRTEGEKRAAAERDAARKRREDARIRRIARECGLDACDERIRLEERRRLRGYVR